MRRFLLFVDTNASAKLYKRHFDMSLEDIRSQMKLVRYYRLYVELADKVVALQRKRASATKEEKVKIQKELREVQALYKPQVLEAKREANE